MCEWINEYSEWVSEWLRHWASVCLFNRNCELQMTQNGTKKHRKRIQQICTCIFWLYMWTKGFWAFWRLSLSQSFVHSSTMIFSIGSWSLLNICPYDFYESHWFRFISHKAYVTVIGMTLLIATFSTKKILWKVSLFIQIWFCYQIQHQTRTEERNKTMNFCERERRISTFAICWKYLWIFMRVYDNNAQKALKLYSFYFCSHKKNI